MRQQSFFQSVTRNLYAFASVNDAFSGANDSFVSAKVRGPRLSKDRKNELEIRGHNSVIRGKGKIEKRNIADNPKFDFFSPGFRCCC